MKDDPELKKLRKQLEDRLDHIIVHGDPPQERPPLISYRRLEIDLFKGRGDRPAYWSYLAYYGYHKYDHLPPPD